MDPKLQWLGSGAWRQTGYWENGRLDVASAVTFDPGPPSRPTTIIGAAGEISGIRFRQVDSLTGVGEREAHVALHQVIWSRIEEALSIAGLGGLAEANFRPALTVVTSRGGWW